MADSRTKGDNRSLQGARSPQTVGQDETLAALSTVTACRRCRYQKLRCSRDLPVCKRCKNISAVCEYPPPPDRKQLATQRLRHAKVRAHRGSESSSSPHGKLDLPIEPGAFSMQRSNDYHAISNIGIPESEEIHEDKNQLASEAGSSCNIAIQAALKRTSLPSTELAIFLFEVYFSRLYNSSLLFHKKTFLADYAANKVPDFVALSIFALASIFLHQSPKHSRQDEDEGEDDVDLGISMVSVSNSSDRGFEWASAASQRVLMQADVPRLETIQACQNLALYWFSVDETDRTHIHTHIAYSTARLLNFHLPRSAGNQMNAPGLFAELERRCYWSSWITNCISQDNATFKTDPWKDSIGLMFPSDEDSYAAGNPIPGECFDENGNSKAMNVMGVDIKPSVMGEFVKLYSLWWEIQRFVKNNGSTKEDRSSNRLLEFLDLDRRLGLIFEHFPEDFRYHNTGSFLFSKIDPYRLFSLHSLYHLCACALHSSIVPLFSNSSSHPLIAKRIVRLSVVESVRHTSATLDMAAAFLSTRLNTSNLPSITGYALFVACTVHFKSLVAQRKFRCRSIGRFKAAILILGRLKQYWTTLQGLWDTLKLLFASKGVNIAAVSTKDGAPPNVTEDEPTDIEKIVSQGENSEFTRATDIFTYVANEETKSDSSRQQSKSPAMTDPNGSVSQDIPRPGNLVPALPDVALEPRLTGQSPSAMPEALTNSQINQEQTQNQNHILNSTSYPFSVPQQPHPSHSSQLVPSCPQHEFTPPFDSLASYPSSLPLLTSQGPPPNYDFGRMGNVTSDSFLPLRPLAEEYGNIQGGVEVPLRIEEGLGLEHTGMYVNPDVAAIDAEMLDSGVLWWDQSFETFDEHMGSMERGMHGFEGFSLG